MNVSLSGKERRLLSLLREASGALPLSEMAEKLRLGEMTTRSLLESLAQKGMVDRHVREEQIYELTPEARRYATKGLPEVRLVRLLARRGGQVSIESLKEEPELTEEETRIGLIWARKNGWVSITRREGETWLALEEKAAEAERHQLQLLLQSVKDTGEFGETEIGGDAASREEIRRILLHRKLAIPRPRRLITATITERGRRALEEAVSLEEQIGDLTPELLRTGAWRERPFRPYNLRGPAPRLYPGKKHPYLEFLERVRRTLIGLGFQEAKGPLVELEFWNCDALFMPQDHVAREVHGIYHVKTPRGLGKIAYPLLLEHVAQTHENGWITKSTGWRYKYSVEIARRLVLRSHTTAVSVRYLAEHKDPPIRMFCIDRNFRPEKFDATHSAEFHQCEGIIGDEGLTLRDLMGYLRAIAEAVGIKKIKFKPGFFPFTEPSVEGFIYTPELGWVEALPGGIFRPEVTRPLGIDFPVLAWGIGIDRLAMAALGISDIRELATRNLKWLRNAPLRF